MRTHHTLSLFLKAVAGWLLEDDVQGREVEYDVSVLGVVGPSSRRGCGLASSPRLSSSNSSMRESFCSYELPERLSSFIVMDSWLRPRSTLSNLLAFFYCMTVRHRSDCDTSSS